MPLDDAARELVAPYVSSASTNVFAVRGLPEEDVAALFAHAVKRSEGIRATLAGLLASQSLDQESFRRASVASPFASEHAAVHLGVERVSLLAATALADGRAARIVERATGPIDGGPVFIAPDAPAEITDAARVAGERLLGAYAALLPRVTEALAKRLAPSLDSRALAHGLIRGLLPAGASTDLAVSASARVVRGLASKLLASSLGEIRRVGAGVVEAARAVAPLFFEGVGASSVHGSSAALVADALRPIYTLPSDGTSATLVVNQPARLLRFDRDALARVALALTYEGCDPRTHASALLDGFAHASARELEDLVRASVARRDRGEPLPRGFEASSVTLELMTDWATYRELGHERCLPEVQRLTCRLGFETPGALGDLGFYDAYGDAMMNAYEAWLGIERQSPAEAQYVVPIGYRVRALWTLDLRSLVESLEAYTSSRSPVGVRRVGQALFRAVTGALPWLQSIARLDLDPVSTLG